MFEGFAAGGGEEGDEAEDGCGGGGGGEPPAEAEEWGVVRASGGECGDAGGECEFRAWEMEAGFGAASGGEEMGEVIIVHGLGGGISRHGAWIRGWSGGVRVRGRRGL